jgi:hypothetical protein
MSSVFNLRLSDLDSKSRAVENVSLSRFIKDNKQVTKKLQVSDLKVSALRRLHVSDLKGSATSKLRLSHLTNRKSKSSSGKLRLSDLAKERKSKSHSKSKSSGKLRLSDLNKKSKSSSSRSRKLSLKDLLGGGSHDYNTSIDAVNSQAERQSSGMYNLEGMDLY